MKSQTRIPAASLLPGLVLFLGCALTNTAADARDDPLQTVEDRSDEARRALHQEALAGKPVERPEAEQTASVTGEIPTEMLAMIYTDLEDKTGGDRSDFDLQRGEAVRWSDGGLGCPEPGALYQQMYIDGYWVVIAYQDKEYDFRVTDRGIFRLCSGLTLPGRVIPAQ